MITYADSGLSKFTRYEKKNLLIAGYKDLSLTEPEACANQCKMDNTCQAFLFRKPIIITDLEEIRGGLKSRPASCSLYNQVLPPSTLTDFENNDVYLKIPNTCVTHSDCPGPLDYCVNNQCVPPLPTSYDNTSNPIYDNRCPFKDNRKTCANYSSNKKEWVVRECRVECMGSCDSELECPKVTSPLGRALIAAGSVVSDGTQSPVTLADLD
jgi:hypothetical protein